MSFEENLRAIVGSLATAQRQAWHGEEQARKIVAFHGPYVLRRFADMAAAFDTPGLYSEQGAIFARRDVHGYHSVEFAANDLHIVLDVTDGEAHLSWLAGGDTDDRPITIETPGAVIDAMLLAAVSAYAKAHAAGTPTFDGGVTGKEAQHV
ncbi:MAG TPA: hypothetical protein VIC60_06820 [Thermomicrobiales bacterium]